MRLVTEVRRFRSDQGLRPGQQVPAVLAGIEGTRLAPHEASIRSLLRLTEPGDSFAATASVLAEGITVELDTAAGIDVAAGAAPAGQGPGRRPQGGGPGRAEAGQRVLPGQGTRRRGGQDPGAARGGAR